MEILPLLVITTKSIIQLLITITLSTSRSSMNAAVLALLEKVLDQEDIFMEITDTTSTIFRPLQPNNNNSRNQLDTLLQSSYERVPIGRENLLHINNGPEIYQLTNYFVLNVSCTMPIQLSPNTT